MERGARLSLVLLLCGLSIIPTAAGVAGSSGSPARITVEPASIPIGMAYDGASVQVEVEVPVGYEAAVRVMGQGETLEMKQKGKLGRVLWMSVGEVTFKAVPAVYFLLSTKPLTDSASPSVLTEWQLGYAALAGAAGWPSGSFLELIKLKEKEGCFLVEEGRLVRSNMAPGGTTDRFTGAFRFPARAPAGEYRVDLFGFQDRRAVRLGSTTVRLEYTGLARILRYVATEHGLIYGAMSVVLAVFAGMSTGFLFHPKRGKGK